MPHGALFQVRQVVGAARYLPPRQQNLLAAGFVAGGVALLAFGDLAGLALLACAALFLITRIRRRPRERR